IELAIGLLEVEPHSIPINILCPIPGTPLEKQAPLQPEEVLDTIAFFRFVHPRTTLRFAGGRSSLSRETQVKAIRIGMNGGVVGDLLTTIGSTVADDKKLVDDAGYSF
ncbi:MAG: biotin biosynthesis bifunctional protein BioAB, partial [Muribaculaceae bacterium]|nr:biotin biosynthesis bifunctional protein BioAB [Muribaculaceae bacterium]